MINTFSRRKLLKLAGYGSGAALLTSFSPFTGSSFTEALTQNPLQTDASYSNQTMLQRAIPASDELLPVIGLGSWLQFDVNASSPERSQLIEVLKLTIEKGGKLIDSSPMYGKAEEVIGELSAASGVQDKLFYATKVWTSGEQNGIDQMNESLHKMKRKQMDLMQIHNLKDWKTHIKTLKKWKSEGKIRYTGITHYAVSAHEQLEQIVQSKAVDFVQFNYSVRVRNAEKRLLNVAKDNGVAVIINEPFESGSLFRLVKGKPLPPWAADYDIKSWAQFFLKYIVSHPAVNCVIPGTSDPAHAIDNMAAGYGKLPDMAGRKKMAEYVENRR